MNFFKSTAAAFFLTLLCNSSFAGMAEDIQKASEDRYKLESSSKFKLLQKRLSKSLYENYEKDFLKKLSEDQSAEAFYILAKTPDRYYSSHRTGPRYSQMPMNILKAMWKLENLAPRVAFLESYILDGENSLDENKLNINEKTIIDTIAFLKEQKDSNGYVSELLESVIISLKSHYDRGLYNKSQENAVLPTGKGLELVILGAEWCGSCHELKKDLASHSITSEFPVSLKLENTVIPMYQIDADLESEYLSEKGYVYKTLPALYLVRNGVVNRLATDLTFVGVQKIVNDKIKTTERVDPSNSILKQSMLRRDNKNFQAVLIGTGMDKDETTIFSYDSLKTVRAMLMDTFNVQMKSILTLFGESAQSKKRDYLYVEDLGKGYRYDYKKAKDLFADAIFSYENLSAILTNNSQVKNNLLVFSGHGTPEGMAMWDSSAYFTPKNMKEIHSASAAQNVIVSGTCFGGTFALSASCGFFAARPDLQASGCWTRSPTDVRDYSNLFFKKILNGNFSEITFEEAHFSTFADKDPKDTPFTSLDALAEKYFKTYKNRLPSKISAYEVAELKGSFPEYRAFDNLFRDYKKGTASFYMDNSIYLKPIEKTFETLLSYYEEVRVPVTVVISLDPIIGKRQIRFATSLDANNSYSSSFHDSQKATEIATQKTLFRSIDMDLMDDVYSSGTRVQLTFIAKSNNKLYSNSFQPGFDFKDNDVLLDNFYFFNQTPSHVQLIKRLLFKKEIATRQDMPQEFKDRYNEITKCETQKIQDFINGKSI